MNQDAVRRQALNEERAVIQRINDYWEATFQRTWEDMQRQRVESARQEPA